MNLKRSTNNLPPNSRPTSRSCSAISWLTALAAAVLVCLLAWPAYAQERPCEVCLTKEEAKKAKANALIAKKYDEQKANAETAERERNAAVAKQNFLGGQLEECRLRDHRKQIDRDQWRDRALELEAKQTNPLRWLSAGACGAFAAGGGALALLGHDVEAWTTAGLAAISCSAIIIFD